MNDLYLLLENLISEKKINYIIIVLLKLNFILHNYILTSSEFAKNAI